MSKYEPLWKYIISRNENTLLLSFEEIALLLGFPIDHSFLNYKSELAEQGYLVDKISLKEKTVKIKRSPKD